MEEQLQRYRKEAYRRLEQAETMEDLNSIQIEYLGKKGAITKVLRNMGSLDPQERPRMGQLANAIRSELEEALNDHKEQLKEKEEDEQLKKERVDCTLPGIPHSRGSLHPLTRLQKELERIFLAMGFSIAGGPEIETEYYNFEALNIPPDHPARDMQDTFFLEGGYLLRTHTSNVQIRAMESQSPPIRIIAPGRCYRVDELDANHSPVFHQLEGLVIDRDVRFSHLKGTLVLAANAIFGKRQVRFRPSYFPFTEPSAEVDVSCFKCQGEGCRFCSQTGWLEILGAGMVNPRVLEMSGIDPEQYTGFAFGMGLDRMAMYRYEIEDIRHFWENDLRFLHQF